MIKLNNKPGFHDQTHNHLHSTITTMACVQYDHEIQGHWVNKCRAMIFNWFASNQLLIIYALSILAMNQSHLPLMWTIDLSFILWYCWLCDFAMLPISGWLSTRSWNILSHRLVKELFPFNLRFPFVICSVSILVETASSVLTPFLHGQLLPKHRIWIGGVNLLKIGWTSVIYLHISAICFQNLLNIIDQCCRNVFATYFYARFMKIFWFFLLFWGLKVVFF
jgi:hypothetical protein